MFPLPHVILSTIFCIILYPFIGNNAFIIWSASIFIDIDHYFWYIINKKSWNLVDAYKKHMKKELNGQYKFHIFHLVELLILIGLLSFYNKIFFYIFIGMLFHYIIDWIDLFIRYNKVKKGRTWSLLMYIKRKWNT